MFGSMIEGVNIQCRMRIPKLFPQSNRDQFDWIESADFWKEKHLGLKFARHLHSFQNLCCQEMTWENDLKYNVLCVWFYLMGSRMIYDCLMFSPWFRDGLTMIYNSSSAVLLMCRYHFTTHVPFVWRILVKPIMDSSWSHSELKQKRV